MPTPLAGLRVLDLSRVLAGPWASQTLADLGADVIKIERPGTGDDTRAWGPPYAKDQQGRATSESAYYLCANRGKKSVTVDITTPEGQSLVCALAEQSDIMIENFKIGALAKYGLDYATLSTLNPRLIYCSITGFGQTGPYSALPGYDFLIQGMGGLMSISGLPDGVPGGGPMKTGVAVADLVSGLYATIAILAAVNRRQSTGLGDVIDISLLDCQVAMLANQAMNYLASGTSPSRLGNAHPNIVPYEAFATADGHIILAVGNDDQFAKFCAVAGCADLANDEKFRTNRARVENRAELIPKLQPSITQRSTRAWLEVLGAAGVPCGPIKSIEDVFEDKQVKSRQLRLDLPHPTAGTVPSVACPIRFGDAELDMSTAPPTLGQHTASILSERLGLTRTDLKKLKDLNAI